MDEIRAIMNKIASDPEKLDALCCFYNLEAVTEAKFDLAVSFPEIYQLIMKFIDLMKDPDSFSQRNYNKPMDAEDKIKVFKLFFTIFL